MNREYYKNLFKEELIKDTNISLVIKDFYVTMRSLYKNFKSEITINSYLCRLNSFEKYLFYCLDDKDISLITKDDLLKYKIFLLETLGLKKTTVNSHLNTLRKFYDYLVNSNIVEHNLASEIKNYKTSSKDLNIVRISEIKIIFDSIRKSTNELKLRDIIVLKIILETGAFLTDILNIKLNDVFIEDKTININNNNYPISSNLISDISDYMVYRDKYTKDYNNYLLINRNGNKYSERSFQLSLKQYIIASDINRKVTARDFRATFLFNIARKVEKEELLKVANQKNVDRYYKILKNNALFNL